MRAGICMIAVPIPICSVVAAIQEATVTASAPQASDVHDGVEAEPVGLLRHARRDPIGSS